MRIGPHTQRALEDHAGRDLAAPLEGPFDLGEGTLPKLATAIYLAADPSGEVVYVGKVASELDRDRLRSRLAEHLGDLRKLNAWAQLYVLPLRSSTSNGRVEAIEGLVSRHMLATPRGRRPDPRRRRGSG